MYGSLKRMLFSPVMASMFLRALGAALSFGVTFAVARWGGAAVSGEYALATQTILTASAIALFGNDRLLIRRIAGDLREGRPDLAGVALWYSVKVVGVASAIAAAIVFVLSPFSEFIGLSPNIMALCAIGVFFFPMQNIAIAALRGMERIVLSQLFYGPFQSMLLLVLIVLLGSSAFALSAEMATLGYIASLVVTAVLSCVVVLRGVRGWPPFEGVKPNYRASNSTAIGLTVTLDMVGAWGTLVLTGFILGLTEIGAFRVCLQIITIMTMIFTTYESIIGPQFAGDFRVKDIAAVKQRYLRAIGILIAFSGVPVLLTLVFPGQILAIFGPEFLIGAQALQILALGQAIVTVIGPAGAILIMSGREKVNLQLSIAGLVVNLCLIPVLVPIWGLAGAAWAVNASIILRSVVALLVVQRVFSPR